MVSLPARGIFHRTSLTAVIVVSGVLIAAALIAQSPTADSLLAVAAGMPESELVMEARAHPLALREAFTKATARAAQEPSLAGAEAIAAARRLADAYAAAWSDSFLVRDIDRFEGWSPARRAARVSADSARRAGITAFGRDGPAAAIRIWRRALRRARAADDSVAVAALLGNMGAAFLANGEPDSARRYLGRARALAAATGDIRVEANALGELAGLSDAAGNPAAAREQYERASALRARIGDTRGVAADLNNLGLLARDLGDLEEARRHFDAALALNRHDGRDAAAATNLVNLAALASLDGQFARAETLYRDALATWRAREMWADAASALRGLGQLEVRRGDYPAAIDALREALAILDRSGPPAEALATRGELADALAATGDPQGALTELRAAQRAADSTRAPAVARAAITLARADLAVRMNAAAEAERLYVRAEALYRLAKDAEGEAQAQEGRGALLLERDDYSAAQRLLNTAWRRQVAAGDRRSAALTRMSLGIVARERGDTASADRQLARAATDLDRLGDPVAAAAAIGERAAIYANAGLPAPAESLYRGALERLKGRVAPEVAWQMHAGLAMVRRARGDADDAARELRQALAELERPRRSLAVAERRSAFLADKWEVYAQLALVERARDHTAAAFEASERLRAREMLELLARGRVAPPIAGSELIAREEDLRRRIGELTRALERGTATAGTREERSAESAAALARAQEDYQELLLELKERSPRHAALVSGQPGDWRAVARHLSSGEVLIEYLVSDSGVVAFVVTGDTIQAVDLGVRRRELTRLIEFTRGVLAPAELSRSDPLWRAPLRRLYEYLVAPIEEQGLLAGATRLVIVPHAELHYLPFAALIEARGQDRFLVERYEVSIAPSASVWLALADRPRTDRGVGLLTLAPSPRTLPASRREVDAIERLSGSRARVLTGAEASEEAFRREAPSRRVLHLATYGVLNRRNPLFSFVELAPSPGFDGRLEVHEVFGLQLAAELVVLSACQTGLGSGSQADVPPGDDWVGLTRAFLHAGARRVVASLWPVDDWATAMLMERFYETLAAGADPVRALASAQRTLAGESVTAHPYYWAGFVVVGGAGARPVALTGEGR